MGCNCGSGGGSGMALATQSPTAWVVYNAENIALSSYRTEVEAAAAAARTPGATYRADRV